MANISYRSGVTCDWARSVADHLDQVLVPACGVLEQADPKPAQIAAPTRPASLIAVLAAGTPYTSEAIWFQNGDLAAPPQMRTSSILVPGARLPL